FLREGLPYLSVRGRELALTCHPYEPCLYITGPEGDRTAVHNSFDPLVMAELFLEGRTARSITGREYGPEDFCRMAEYACGKGDIQIDDAEKVFDDVEDPGKARQNDKEGCRAPAACDAPVPVGLVITDDPFYALASEYPDSAVEYCLVSNPHTGSEEQDHRTALSAAVGKLFFDGGERVWNGSPEMARGKPIDAEALFAPAGDTLNYRRAFLCPPWGSDHGERDFDRVNAALFPRGISGLTAYEWTTDWSDYFDDGREWWGTLCLTVHDSLTDRFAVILASATD
ncbi:MAG: hypothetical protein IJT95_07035, partial [Abditibacteriota bacterium]|nr:hypothetical protein [Abditibacteriota bacterium]